jgi:hypothetical protein
MYQQICSNPIQFCYFHNFEIYWKCIPINMKPARPWMLAKNKLSPIYLGPKNLDTFWCTGWAWNCQIIFRCASIHGRAGFILIGKRLNKLKNKWLLLHTGSGFQWYRTYERGYKTSGSPLHFMLRRSSLIECVSVFEQKAVGWQRNLGLVLSMSISLYLYNVNANGMRHKFNNNLPSPYTSFIIDILIFVIWIVKMHWYVGALSIRKTVDLPPQLWVGTFPRFVAIGFYFLSKTLI